MNSIDSDKDININAIWIFDKIIFNVWANWIFSNFAKYQLYVNRSMKRLETPMILRILKCMYIMAYKIDKKPLQTQLNNCQKC